MWSPSSCLSVAQSYPKGKGGWPPADTIVPIPVMEGSN